MKYLLSYFLTGTWFGVLLTKSEVISWIRIQEMFRFDSVHMYGVLGTGVGVGMVSLWVMKRWFLRPGEGLPKKPFQKGNLYGGLLFGIGWAMTGACPGPIYALVGYGYLPMLLTLLAALLGAWVYGLLRPKLPH